jgi:phosphonate transport system substrate-binding protein
MQTITPFFRVLIAGVWFVTGLANAVETRNGAPCGRDGTLTFGFLPLVSTEKLVQRFAPLVHYLSAELGIPIRIETAADFETFIRRTDNEKRYDLLFTAPHLFYIARKNAGYQLLASVDSPGMSAVIVAPQQSKVETIKDLAGLKLATVDPMSLATLLVRKQLEENGLNPDVDLTLVTTPSHNASLLSS